MNGLPEENDMSNFEDYAYEYSGAAHVLRVLEDGRFNVEVLSVKPTKSQGGKYKDAAQLEWHASVCDGHLKGLHMKWTSLLAPPLMVWTSERFFSAIFPALKVGDKFNPLVDCVGKRLEVLIKTEINVKNGQVSMYVKVFEAKPYVAVGFAENPEIVEGDVPF